MDRRKIVAIRRPFAFFISNLRVFTDPCRISEGLLAVFQAGSFRLYSFPDSCHSAINLLTGSYLATKMRVTLSQGASSMKRPLTRNPHGTVKNRPIALRLMPEELAEADELSSLSGRSKSSLARDAYLKGIKLVKESLLPTSTGLDGGSDKSDSAVFSSCQG